MAKALLTMAIRQEQDVVIARQRAREIARIVGFDGQDQTRIATAVSEIVRNAFRYAKGGKVEFALEGASSPQLLMIRVRDEGPGIADLAHVMSGQYQSTTGMGVGIIGAHRLMDQVEIDTKPGVGTNVLLTKILPSRAPLITSAQFTRITSQLSTTMSGDALGELQEQNRELVRALGELRERQEELLSLNRELEDTNRGVVALYAELDEKADHLRRADEMKSRFLSNMSHEFRTPLNSIRALSRLLLDRIDGDLSVEQEKQVGFISKASDDLTALVDDLLDLAKIEAGKIEVHPIEFSVGNLFSALRGMLRPLLVGDAVKLSFEEPQSTLTLYNDEGKVSQILRNFISNAIKFTEQGEVCVSAQLSEDRQTVRFSVADTGIGIAPEDQGRIFDEFTQLPSALQGRVKGTGLGLPLCRRLAHLLGGDVSVKSERGVGSVFTAEVSANFEKSDSTASKPVDTTVELGRSMVLVLDDDVEMRLIYEKHLRDSHYQPLTTRSLREARELMKRAHPQAIILDIVLRGEDTWRWLNELKSNPATAGVPVIVITSIDDERKGLALGADAYCLKPVERSVLLEKLDALTARRILIIDDDPAARYLMQKLLADTHTTLLEAEDGRSGLIAARRARPSMIFLDLGLPDFSGEEILEVLKNDADLQNVPVAIVTASKLTNDERTRLGRRADVVLQKSDLSSERARAILASNGVKT
jgi:signal transduction histidine kinase/DNA-binding response OmpR family regulator